MSATVKQLDDAPRDMFFETANALIEMPTYYQVGGHDYFLYPPSIGTQMLITNTLKAHHMENVSSKTNILSVLKILKEQKGFIARILAICSFMNRKDAVVQPILDKRAEELEEIDIQDGVALALRAINYSNDYDEFVKHYGIDRELEERKRVSSIKEDNNGITFGGLSIWGSLIDAACSRYGWTMDYVLWGISALNLNMLMTDAITSVYLTDDEEKRLGGKHKAINADDPQNTELIRSLLND